MFNFNLKLGRLAGVPIILSPEWFLLIIGVPIVAVFTRSPLIALDVFLYLLAIYAFVLLHEFGHILTAKQFGAETDSITINIFGGIALIDWTKLINNRFATFLVALAGPATNFVLFVLFGLLEYILHKQVFISSVIHYLTIANLGLAVFNLIPVVPLDGSMIVYSGLRMFMKRDKADRALAIFGFVGAAVLLGLCVYFQNFIFGLISGISVASSYRIYKHGMFYNGHDGRWA